MLNITHTYLTLIVDEFVWGVSGGEQIVDDHHMHIDTITGFQISIITYSFNLYEQFEKLLLSWCELCV
jgi:hypothetical protein